MIEKFSIDIPQKDIEFLNKKLATTRWPDELDNKDWADGTNLEFLKDYLSSAGFKKIEKVKFFSIFNDTSNYAPYNEVPISLNIIAYK